MEEFDGIIIHNLRQIDCDIPEDVVSLLNFSTEMVVESVVACLQCINPENSELSKRLPPGMSARFRIASAIAAAIEQLGYKGDLGYQTILYSNDADIRQIFMFLIEKLPRDNLESTRPADESGSNLARRLLANQLRLALELPWLPYHACLNGVVRDATGAPHYCGTAAEHSVLRQCRWVSRVPYSPATEAMRRHINEDLCCVRDIPLALLSDNALMVAREQTVDVLERGGDQDKILQTPGFPEIEELSIKNSTDSRSSRLAQQSLLMSAAKEEDNAVDRTAEHRENEVKLRKEELGLLVGKLSGMESAVKGADDKIAEANELLSRLTAANKAAEQNYKSHKKTLQLLQNPEVNVEKLRELIAASEANLQSLHGQWDRHRVPLEGEIQELTKRREANSEGLQGKMEAIKEIRRNVQILVEETKEKEELAKQLKVEFDAMVKDVNRAAYTKRIIEIINNINRQKQEMEKIMNETKSLQKEMNLLRGKLERTFTVTDELVFRHAPKDEFAKKAYKYLASLHSACDEVVKLVQDTGQIIREARELGDHIDNESEKNVDASLDNILKDYKAMREENARLKEQLHLDKQTT